MIDTHRRLQRINKTTTLIYTMGKVGSTELYNTIDNSHQIHNLDSEAPAKNFSARFTPSLRRYIIESVRWKLLNRKLLKSLSEAKRDKHSVKIITMVRDPVARNLSAFFQNLDQSQVTAKTSITSDFFAYTNHLLPLTWFDVEFKKHLDIDIYRHPFDSTRGWERIRENGYDILILQLESLAHNVEIISDFIGSASYSLSQQKGTYNTGKTKWYAELYSSAKDHISFSEEYINLMYSSKFAKHFYSTHQLETFRQHWKRDRTTKE